MGLGVKSEWRLCINDSFFGLDFLLLLAIAQQGTFFYLTLIVNHSLVASRSINEK